MTKQPQRQITPISEWLDNYDVVELPSGKVVGLRQVDVLSILTEEGNVPNILLPVVQGHMANVPTDDKGNMIVDLEELAQLNRLLDKLTRATFAKPKVVDTLEQVEAGKGILSSMVPYTDKIALISYAMGGQQAIDASRNFLEQSASNLDALQEMQRIQSNTQPSPEDNK